MKNDPAADGANGVLWDIVVQSISSRGNIWGMYLGETVKTTSNIGEAKVGIVIISDDSL